MPPIGRQSNFATASFHLRPKGGLNPVVDIQRRTTAIPITAAGCAVARYPTPSGAHDPYRKFGIENSQPQRRDGQVDRSGTAIGARFADTAAYASLMGAPWRGLEPGRSRPRAARRSNPQCYVASKCSGTVDQLACADTGHHACRCDQDGFLRHSRGPARSHARQRRGDCRPAGCATCSGSLRKLASSSSRRQKSNGGWGRPRFHVRPSPDFLAGNSRF